MTLDTAARARLMRELATVCAIPVTPFHPDGEVDWDGYRQTVIAIAAGGVSVVTPNGNTGEFYALTREECDRAVAVTCEAVGDRTLVMPGVGYDVRTAIALGEAARRAGAKAVMVHQPVHPYQSADGWVAYHAEIARAGLPLWQGDGRAQAGQLAFNPLDVALDRLARRALEVRPSGTAR